MILTFGSLANSTPYLGGILLAIVLAWLGAAKSLDSQFSHLAKEELEKEKRWKEKAEESVLKVSEEGTDGSVGNIKVQSIENASVHESLASEKTSNGSSLKPKVAAELDSSPESSTPLIQ